MVMMWSAPETDSMFATNLAEMGARLCRKQEDQTSYCNTFQQITKHSTSMHTNVLPLTFTERQ